MVNVNGLNYWKGKDVGDQGATGVVSNPPTSFFDDSEQKRWERFRNDPQYAHNYALKREAREDAAMRSENNANAVSLFTQANPFVNEGEHRYADYDGIRYNFTGKNGQWVVTATQNLNPFAKRS